MAADEEGYVSRVERERDEAHELLRELFMAVTTDMHPQAPEDSRRAVVRALTSTEDFLSRTEVGEGGS